MVTTYITAAHITKCLLLTLFWVLLSACDSSKKEQKATQPTAKTAKIRIDTQSRDADTGRWYTLAQQQQGRQLFAKHCAACHGDKAQETVDWKTPTATGHYPPPPLNGTAHAWHHPLSVLQTVIRGGGAPMGGVMPAWGDVLSEEEIIATIASFQTYWPDDVYQRWLEIDMQSRQ
ncbi:MAG: c-type cytochrome [Cellvibrionaceae bacterium]